MNQYVRLSLETHLFFCRIMKEHSLFLMAGFPCKNEDYIKKADWYRNEFENLLEQVVELSDGVVRNPVLDSGEIVTEFTLDAEKSTACLTGIPIDSSITEAEKRLSGSCDCQNNQMMRSGQWGQNRPMNDREMRMTRQVNEINNRALELLRGLICLKEDILNNVLSCKLFTANYPLLIEHILREARLYQDTIAELNERGFIRSRNLKTMEQFWNRIMMEHAFFIRGLLDPTEETLILTADDFAGDYRALLREAREADGRCLEELTEKTIQQTKEYRDFKAAGTKGITDCEIRSVILPLLADHVLREANHYLRILQEG